MVVDLTKWRDSLHSFVSMHRDQAVWQNFATTGTSVGTLVKLRFHFEMFVLYELILDVLVDVRYFNELVLVLNGVLGHFINLIIVLGFQYLAFVLLGVGNCWVLAEVCRRPTVVNPLVNLRWQQWRSSINHPADKLS